MVQPMRFRSANDSIGAIAAKWIQDEVLMCNHIRACMNEAKDLFVQRIDDDFNFCWSLPEDIDSKWREVLEHVICFNLQEATNSMRLVKTVHPHMPFNPRLLARFRHVLSNAEHGNDMSLFASLDHRINKSIQLLTGWVIMRRRLQKPADPLNQDAGLLDNPPQKEKTSADESDIIRAVEYCDLNYLEKTDESVLRIVRKVFRLTCGNNRFQKLKNSLKKTGRWKE